MCDETFEDLNNLEAHIVSKVCQDKFKKLKIDFDEKFQSDLCDRLYDMKKNPVAYINWKHKDRESYKCGSFELTCLYKNLLARHMKKTHGQDE